MFTALTFILLIQVKEKISRHFSFFLSLSEQCKPALFEMCPWRSFDIPHINLIFSNTLLNGNDSATPGLCLQFDQACMS